MLLYKNKLLDICGEKMLMKLKYLVDNRQILQDLNNGIFRYRCLYLFLIYLRRQIIRIILVKYWKLCIKNVRIKIYKIKIKNSVDGFDS